MASILKPFMRYLFFLPLLFCGQHLSGQTFIDSYKDFYTTKIKQSTTFSISTPIEGDIRAIGRKIKRAKKAQLDRLRQQIKQFDTIFNAYKRKTGFDFNTASSLTLIYQTEIESNLRDYIIFSGRDTISYGEIWFVEPGKKTRKVIQYRPFLDTTSRPKGFRVYDVRDSLLTIASKRNCGTVQLQIKESKVLDGRSSSIIIATKQSGRFFIEECFLEPFGFVPIWRKE
jgi:hypothetical protein